MSASSSAGRRKEPSPFARRVLAAVRRIPAGLVATYGDIAALAGSPRAARAVGSILRECRDPYTPCHRVIGAGGSLGGYRQATWASSAPGWRAEGLDVTPTRVRRFADVRWRGHTARATRRRTDPV